MQREVAWLLKEHAELIEETRTGFIVVGTRKYIYGQGYRIKRTEVGAQWLERLYTYEKMFRRLGDSGERALSKKFGFHRAIAEEPPKKRRRKAATKAAAFLLALLLAPQAHADLVLFGRIYDRNTTVSAVPVRHQPMIGEFGLDYASKGRFVFIGSVDSKVYRSAYGWKTLGSVSYHFGLRWQAMGPAVLELKHGSWHNIDAAGPTEVYNRLGLEVKLP